VLHLGAADRQEAVEEARQFGHKLTYGMATIKVDQRARRRRPMLEWH
jgi:hypothetical protein